MTKDEIIQIISKKIKLVRTEADYSQDLMADILGISKKTLVQIEKSRISASWTVAVALCALFKDSEILQNSFGGDPLEVLQTVAHRNRPLPKEYTLGGKVWWLDVEGLGQFKLQKNIVSGHFRILDKNNRRWSSSFDEIEIRKNLQELNKCYPHS